MIMHVLVVELLCQMMMEQILALESLLPGTCGCIWLCPILSNIEWPRYRRISALGPLARCLGYPRRGYRGPGRILSQGLVWTAPESCSF
jgi:hypothetical protein